MANLSDFFPASSGATVATAADLPRLNLRSNSLYIKASSSTYYQSEQNDFWTRYARQYAHTTQTSSTTEYTTIVDVSSSNGGVLFHVIGGSQYYSIATHDQYIKVTIDGVATEIGPINNSTYQYRAYHPVLGALLPFQPATSHRGLFTNVDRWFDNNNAYRQTKGFWAARGDEYFTIPTPSEAELLPKIRFNSTLKVELKGTVATTYNGDKVGCAYKLF